MDKLRFVIPAVILLFAAVADGTAQAPPRWSVGPVGGLAWPSEPSAMPSYDPQVYGSAGAGVELHGFPANWSSLRMEADYIWGLQSSDARLSYIDIPVWLRVVPAGHGWFGEHMDIFGQLGVTASMLVSCYAVLGATRQSEGECDEVRNVAAALRFSPVEMGVGIGGGVEFRRANDENESITIEFRYTRGVVSRGSHLAARYPAVSLLVGYHFILGRPVANQ